MRQAKGSEEKTKSSHKKAKSSPAALSDTPKENDKSTFRFAPKMLTVHSDAVFAVFRDDFDRMQAAGFNFEFYNVPPALMQSPTSSPPTSSPRSRDTLPTCKISKHAGISKTRFEEVAALEPALRALQPDVKEFEACGPWIKKEGFCFVDDFLQKTVTIIQPLPHGSINCFWEGPSSRLGMAQYPSRGVREEMWWEHSQGYFANFSFSIQNYKKGDGELQTTPRAEWLKLAFRDCGKCKESVQGKYCVCRDDITSKPTDEVICDHVMLSSNNDEVPRRSPSCWFNNEHLAAADFHHKPGGKKTKKSAVEFLKKCAVVKSPEKLFKDLARQFNANLTGFEKELHELTADEVLAVMLYSGE
jgi:hypothetical protein